MIKKMTILYEVEDSLYINLTNKCPCHCTFCIRQEDDGAYGSDSLWLEHEPSLEEVISEFEKVNLEKYKQVVFCGYGEPLTRIQTVVEVCKYIRGKGSIPIRVNTNGLADLIHHKPVAEMLKGYVDAISISLNAPTSARYREIVNPCFKEEAFPSLLSFIKEVKAYVPKVIVTVVDTTITAEEIELCRKIAEDLEVHFRVRSFV